MVNSAVFFIYLQLSIKCVIDFLDALLSKQQHNLGHVRKTKIFSIQLYSFLLTLIVYWTISLIYMNTFLLVTSCCSSTLDYTGIQDNIKHVIVKYGVVYGADLLFHVAIIRPFFGYRDSSVEKEENLNLRTRYTCSQPFILNLSHNVTLLIP